MKRNNPAENGLPNSAVGARAGRQDNSYPVSKLSRSAKSCANASRVCFERFVDLVAAIPVKIQVSRVEIFHELPNNLWYSNLAKKR